MVKINFKLEDIDVVDYIDGFKAYPLIKIYIGYKGESGVRDSFPLLHMLKELPSSIEELKDLVSARCDKLNLLKDAIRDVEVDFFRFDTWYLTWFQHQTYEQGLTDEEVLSSFRNFVDRNKGSNSDFEKNASLMGADEEWRWRSSEKDKQGNEKPAPCRCTGCTEKGIIRINH